MASDLGLHCLPKCHKKDARHILGQTRNAAYKDLKYCMFNEGNKISSAIYVSLLFLPHTIPIVY